MVACALGGSLYCRRSCRTFLKQNIEPWVKKMGPNSELRSSSLKIRRKHFLNIIFWHLSYLHDFNEPHQAYNRFAHL
ncbi:hypothetical protein DVH24_005786 [Malus domestica]|uniref:Uncharacterized protein n=1 Tax=Malus domestica TaxID=3750 RepID=A0A498IQM0_MALDO|nr:hypothetical protein DVH24_005786 [Malus domestica]